MIFSQYPLASSTWGTEEIDAMQRVISSGKFTMGEKVREFEAEFAKTVGSKYSVMVNSGSSANLVLLTAGKYLSKPFYAQNDEIIVPAVSWSTTYYPVNQIGCKLSFVDVELDSLNLDPSKVVEAITPRTKAILAVNLLGNACDLKELQKIADDHGLQLLEDNCESLAGTLDGKSLGTIGVGGTFSSFFSHHISTMEGGLIATDNEELYQVMKSIRAHGWTRDLPEDNLIFNKTGDSWEDLFRFVLPGFNLRPLELEAAIGLEQLIKLPSFISVRRNNAILFKEIMQEFSDIQIQRELGESSWFGFSLILKGSLRGKRGEFVRHLNAQGIESRPIVAGNFTKNPVIKHLDHVAIPELPIADEIHKNGLFIGNHHYDLNHQLEHLGMALRDFVRKVGTQ
jgi:CDP-6-deoxy-D-xylo-4-hexulose-3-dehydrase